MLGRASPSWFVLAQPVNAVGGAQDHPAEESLGGQLGKLGGRERGILGVLAAGVTELSLVFP